MGGADVGEATWERMLDHGREALDGRTMPAWVAFHEGEAL
jgi:hypothetical protein